MSTVNLRDIYPQYYKTDVYIELPDEIIEAMRQADRAEKAYRLREYRHKAYYSLDHGDGIENQILFRVESPVELYERQLTTQELYAALHSLPDKQAKRIYAHFMLGMSKAEIARTEGVEHNAVRKSIKQGLKRMEKFLKNL